MNILLTMCYLRDRSGAEWFTLDLALALHRRGHRVAVFTFGGFGDMAQPLHDAAIPCLTRLQQLTWLPDVVIGNTHDETVAAAAFLPGTPLLPVCHDADAQHGLPPGGPDVHAWCAVDLACLQRLTLDCGIDPGKIRRMHNGVERGRFAPRSALPTRPVRALIFSNYSTPGPETDALLAGCERAGVQLDMLGAGMGQQSPDPGAVLGSYDLVFGVARCAAEALVTGCGVVLFKQGFGLGPLVTRDRIAHLHGWNYGRGELTAPVTAERVAAEIRRWDADDAMACVHWARDHCDQSAAVDRWEALCREAVALRPPGRAPWSALRRRWLRWRGSGSPSRRLAR